MLQSCLDHLNIISFPEFLSSTFFKVKMNTVIDMIMNYSDLRVLYLP